MLFLSFSPFRNNHVYFGLRWCKCKARLKDHELLLWETTAKEEQWEMNCKCYCQVQTVNIREVAGLIPSSKYLLISAVWYLDPFVGRFLMDWVKILISILTFRPWSRVDHSLLLTTRYLWKLYSAAEVWVITWKQIRNDLNLNIWQTHAGILPQEGTQCTWTHRALTQYAQLFKADNFAHMIFANEEWNLWSSCPIALSP